MHTDMTDDARISRDIFPYVRLSGSPEEIGFQHGRLLARRIERCWEFYERIIGGKSSEVQQLARGFAKMINGFSAEYAREIEALSEGAGMPSWQIYALNSRTELIRILNRKGSERAPQECTTLYFPSARILGQTWDWAAELHSLAVIMEINQPGKPCILQVTEPGIIGKIGLNSAGVGVCLNILRAPLKDAGLPVHILLRAVLESQSTAEAVDRVRSAALGTMSHLCIGDRGGNCMPLEIAGAELAICRLPEHAYIHTNHFLELPVDNPRAEFASSYCRIERAADLASTIEEESVPVMKTMLTDTNNGAQAICHDFVPDDVIDSEGTLCAVIFELEKKRAHICPGSPLVHAFETYDLEGRS